MNSDFLLLQLDSVDSTNNFLRAYIPAEPCKITLVAAEYQTAGRGATGAWESEPGKNLVFSILTHPTMVPAPRMYVLSEAIALSVRDALNSFHEGFVVKWPNDIYYGDKKVVGMLIENDLKGKTVSNCVMGVGVNVNQREFHSDAPNPSSLSLIVGRDIDRSAVLDSIAKHFRGYYEKVESGRFEEIHAAYTSQLYWKNEEHSYRDADGEFRATLVDVEPTGHLVLVDDHGATRRYDFKEVSFVVHSS